MSRSEWWMLTGVAIIGLGAIALNGPFWGGLLLIGLGLALPVLIWLARR